MSGETPYIESNVLLAALSGDVEAAIQGMRTMLPGELVLLSNACVRVSVLCHDVCDELAATPNPSTPTGDKA